MQFLTRTLQHSFVLHSTAALIVNYVRAVGLTSRVDYNPPDFAARLDALSPAIVVTWHGQLGLMPLILAPSSRFVVLTTKHRDGALVEAICDRLGVDVVRGARHKPGRKQKSNGIVQIRQLLRRIEGGYSVGITADAPKQARIALGGAIMLAQLSGRPILPVAAVANRSLDLDTWDRASIPMPFSHCNICVGEPITVGPDVDHQHIDRLCTDLTDKVNAVFRDAFGRINTPDPGLRPVSV